MSENDWPAATSPSRPAKSASRSRRSSRTPMASDRMYNIANIEESTGRSQLISPPPEETLHFRRSSGAIRVPFTPSLLASSSKRKRNVRQATEPTVEPLPPLETTPNPKPRKQSKHRTVYVEAESPTRVSHRSSTPTTPSNPTSARKYTKSPHRHNPDADFIPPVPSSGSRRDTISARARRTTPIPAYEPPSDVFTPPRVVTLTPTISKSSKRKSTSKAKPRRVTPEELRIVIKKELPPIDLSAPMPPPSPTDDPLLLTSTPIRAPPPRRLREVVVATSSPVQEQQSALPPSSSPIGDDDLPDGHQFDWGHTTSSEFNTSMDVDDLPLFNLNLPNTSEIQDDGWSDSEDDPPTAAMEGEVGEGEYTGRFRMLNVRTKQDPPSSATKERMDRWGRPITPFPREKKVERLNLVEEEEEEEREEDLQEGDTEMDGQDLAADQHSEEDENEGEEEEREMSVHTEDEEVEQHQASEESDQEPIDQDPPNGTFASDESTDSQGNVDPPTAQDRPTYAMITDDHDDDSYREHSGLEEDAPSDEEEHQVHEMSDIDDDQDASVRPNIAPPMPNISRFSLASQQARANIRPVPFPSTQPVDDEVDQDEAALIDMPDDDESDASEDVDSNVVKISSADPRAAARAAAILKQYDYDCYTKIMLKQRKRHSIGSLHGVSSGGITKSTDAKDKHRRRTTMGTSIIGDRVYMPGSPATTLPELLKEAEESVISNKPHPKPISTFLELDSRQNVFETPARRSAVSETMVPLDITPGERQWAKDDWKLLDACFTDERLALGGMEGMASVDRVNPEDVVARFLDMLGGPGIVETFGDGWDSESLIRRVKALQNKQRSGNVAPPTTPYTPSPNAFSHSRRIPSMEVPDFTPLGPRPRPPTRTSRPVLPPPVAENAPFSNMPPSKGKESVKLRTKLPMTLLAPRYSHLLEEAVAISRLPPMEIPSEQISNPDLDPDDILNDTSAIDENGEESEDETETVPLEANLETAVSRSPSPVLQESDAVEPTTIGKRVKGFLFSYLPTLSHTAPPGPRKASHQLPRHPGLPLPPPDLLNKPRGPIDTPVRAPAPKVPHPKELVQLNPAPLPPTKPTMIPKIKAKRLVDLHPVTPPPPKEKLIPRPRRSSGGSVKDLVKTFEHMESKKESSKAAELRRVRSIGDWRKTAGPQAGSSANAKPSWRP